MIPSKNLGSEDPSYIRIAACRASVELKLPAAISSLPQISCGTLNRSLRRNVTFSCGQISLRSHRTLMSLYGPRRGVEERGPYHYKSWSAQQLSRAPAGQNPLDVLQSQFV